MTLVAIRLWLGRNWPALALVGAVGFAGWLAYGWAYQRGYDAREAELQALRAAKQSELFDLADRISAAEAELQARTRAMSENSRRIEDEARADSGACRRVSPDSLQRLERRWGN